MQALEYALMQINQNNRERRGRRYVQHWLNETVSVSSCSGVDDIGSIVTESETDWIDRFLEASNRFIERSITSHGAVKDETSDREHEEDEDMDLFDNHEADADDDPTTQHQEVEDLPTTAEP